MLTSVLSHQSPYQVLFHKQPPSLSFKLLGCLCIPYLRPYTKSSLYSRSQHCVFLGYSSSHKEYICLHVATNHIYITKHVMFDELCFPFSSVLSSSPSVSIFSVHPLAFRISFSSPSISTSSPLPQPSSSASPLLILPTSPPLMLSILLQI